MSDHAKSINEGNTAINDTNVVLSMAFKFPLATLVVHFSVLLPTTKGEPGRVAQSVTRLTTDAYLTADTDPDPVP